MTYVRAHALYVTGQNHSATFCTLIPGQFLKGNDVPTTVKWKLQFFQILLQLCVF
jgi:hypothetical protein